MSRCDICWGPEMQEVFVALINYVGSCFSSVLLNKGRSGLLCKTQRGHAGKGDFPRAAFQGCPGVPGGIIMSINGFSAQVPAVNTLFV